MRTGVNVGKADEGVKGAVFGPVRERIYEMVRGAMEGTKEALERELSGIPLLVMRLIMELELEQVVGRKHQHRRERTHSRWGTNPGSVVINGERVRCEVPRAMEKETRRAYRLKSYTVFRQATDLVKRAYRDLIRGVSTRQYQEGVTRFLDGYGRSAATVSRRMIAATSEKVKELFERRLEDLDLCVLMIDGVRVAEQTVVVALGIDTEGMKHVLGLWQGATENTRLARKLLEELVERGLEVDRPLVAVIDGSKALRRAVEEVLGSETPVQRCTVHKKRNVLDELPQSHQREVSRRMTRAYQMASVDDARRELLTLTNDLERINPSAARSLQEGLEETLTLHRLGLPEALRKTLRSTNLIESAISVVRQRTRNVKRWRDGHQIERWIGAGLVEAESRFRRIKGYGALKNLISALTNTRKNKHQAA